MTLSSLSPLSPPELRRLAWLVVPVVLGCGGGRSAGGTPPAPVSPPPASSVQILRGEPSRWSGHIAAGKTIDVRAIRGSIRATAATGDVATVEGRAPAGAAGAAGSGPTATGMRVVETEEGIEVRPERPLEAGRSLEEHDGDCERAGAASRLDLDFAVSVPAGVRLRGRTVEGAVVVESLASPIDVRTVNGSIDLRRVAQAEARTVNGTITASFTGTSWTQDVELATVQGALEVTLPATADAQLRASTVNGDIRFDFPAQGPVGPHRASATLGRGGKELRLRTVNGGIHVGKA